MSYANAARQAAESGVTSVPSDIQSANTQQTQKTQKTQAKKPPQKVVDKDQAEPKSVTKPIVERERSVAKYEGNLMGAFNQLVSSVPYDKSQSNPQEKVQSKLRPPKPFTIRKFLVALGWPSLLLGLTCHSFDDELKEIRHRFDPRTEKVHFSLVLHMREREKKPEEGEQKEKEKEKEKSTEKPVPSFEGTVLKEYKPAEITGQKRKALVKYWQKVVAVAQYKKDTRKVNLGGGLVLTLSGGAPFLDTKDLSTLNLWMDAICKLLRGSRKEQIPYQDGSVSLSRCGSNGNFVIVRPDLKAHTSGQLPPSQIYKLEDFCVSLRAVVKSFLPLVTQFQLISNAESKKVNEGAADDYVERENIIKNILKPDRLDAAKATVKKLIQSGAIVGSQLPIKFEKKAAAKKEYENEYQTAVAYLTELISQESLDNARRQAVELSEKAAKERAELGEQRRAENEEKRRIQREIESKQKDVLHPRDKDGKYIERAPKPKAPEPEKEKALIQKKKTVIGEDGFKTVTTEVYDPTDNRKVKELQKKAGPKGSLTTVVTVYEANGKTTTVEEKQKPKAPKVDPSQKPKALLDSNPFAAANQEHLYESPSQLLAAASKSKAEGIAEKKLKEQQAAPKKPNTAQPAKKAQAPNPAPKPAAQPKAAPVQPKPQEKPQPKQTPAQPKKQAKQPKQKKALVPQEKPFWQDQKSQPLMVGLGFFVVALALGYTFLVNGTV